MPRFIINELDTEYAESDVEHIHKVIEVLCERLDYPIEDVKKLFYMETVLANIWNIEDGLAVNEAQMQVAETVCGIR